MPPGVLDIAWPPMDVSDSEEVESLFDSRQPLARASTSTVTKVVNVRVIPILP